METETCRIEKRLIASIACGEFGVNSPLPSRAELARRLCVGEWTVRAALRRLVSAGLVSPCRGRGHLVVGLPRKPIAPKLVVDVNLEPWYSFGPSVSLFECGKVLRESGCRVLSIPLAGSQGSRPYIAPLLDALAESPDFVIVRSCFSRRKNTLELVAERGIPFATVGMSPKFTRFELQKGNVFYDYGPAVADFDRACRQAGVRKVVQLDFGRNSYLDASPLLISHGIEVERIRCSIEGPHDLDELVASAYDAICSRLRRGALPDLFFFTDDYLALGAFDALRSNGVSVPRDVRVVSFSNHKSGLAALGETTRIEFDPYADGRRIAECTLAYFSAGVFGDYESCNRYCRGTTF